MNQHLGIVGGGQLGRMLALAAAPLGIRCTFLDPSDSSCAGYLGGQIVADYGDASALDQLLKTVERVTFEFENVPPDAITRLADAVPAFPPPQALATARDRWAEKTLFREQGIPLPAIAAVDSQADLEKAVAETGLPAVLKTRTLGYDGKGQKVLRTAADVAGAFAEVGKVPAILEGFVDFDDELSCIGVRAADGEIRFYDLVRNTHDNGILFLSEPQPGHPLQPLAETHTRRVMEALDYVGTMAFEFFRQGDRLIANEIAPRVHNSGHWTIEGAVTSQFENHIRAVCGLPLGDTAMRQPVAMLNVYGQHPNAEALLALPDVHWHDYDKGPRPGRKIGHVTVLADDDQTLSSRLQQAQALLRNERG